MCRNIVQQIGNSHHANYIRKIVHKQPPTPIRTNNSTEEGLAKKYCSNVNQDQWICNFTGLEIEFGRASSSFIEDQEQPIMLIITQKYHPAAHHCLIRYNHLQPIPDGSKYAN